MKSWFAINELKEKKFETFLHLFRYDYARKKLDGKVLDIGCGSGFNLKNNDWYGIDTNRESIFHSKKIGNVRYGSITDIPFKSKTFDGVCCLEVIEHVKAKEKPIREMSRILKDESKVVISTPNPRLVNIAKMLGWKDKVHESKDYYISESEMKKIFEKHGFHLKESKHFFWFPTFLEVLFPISNLLGEIFRPLCYNYILLFERQK